MAPTSREAVVVGSVDDLGRAGLIPARSTLVQAD